MSEQTTPLIKDTPEEIVKAIDEVPRLQIQWMIKRYGDRRATEARDEIMSNIGITIEKEIEDGFNRITKMIDELCEKTIDIMKARNLQE